MEAFSEGPEMEEKKKSEADSSITRVPLKGCFWDPLTVQPSCVERQKNRVGGDTVKSG